MGLLKRLFGQSEQTTSSSVTQDGLMKELQRSHDLVKELLPVLDGVVSGNPTKYKGDINVFFDEIKRAGAYAHEVHPWIRRGGRKGYAHLRKDIADDLRVDSYDLDIRWKMDFYGLAGNMTHGCSPNAFQYRGPPLDRIIHISKWEEITEKFYNKFEGRVSGGLSFINTVADNPLFISNAERRVRSGFDFLSLLEGHLRRDRFYGEMTLMGNLYHFGERGRKERKISGLAHWDCATWKTIEEGGICNTSGRYGMTDFGLIDFNGVKTVFHERVE